MPLAEAEADVSQVEETAHIRSSGSSRERQGGRERPLCLRETTVAVWRRGSCGWKKRFALRSIGSTCSGPVLSQGMRDRPLSQLAAAVSLQKSRTDP